MSVGLYSGVSGLALGTGLYRNVSGLWSGASGLDAGFGGSSPFSGASLYLDFLAGAPLDSRVTFTRGSNATLVDSTGKITYAPANLLLQSQTFDNASWTKNAITVSANSTTAPDGTLTADTITPSTASGAHNIYASFTYPAATHTLSVYVKPNGYSWIKLGSMFTGQGVFFDISNGVVGTANAGYTGTITAAGNGWYRCAVTQTAAAGADLPGLYVASSGSVVSFAGDGTSGIFLWGAQLEPVTYQTTPSTYVATTTAAYYGPRFDYDPVTLAPKGLLIEEQRTNLVLYSEQFNNVAGWSFFNATVTANVTASPDGTTNGDALVENATAGTHVCQQFVNYTSGTAYTYSVYVKAGTRNWVWLGLPSSAFSSGVSSFYNLVGSGSLGTAAGSPTSRSITAVGNGWYRITLTATATATAGGNTVIGAASADNTSFYTGVAAAEALYLYGADIEAGAFATSYIPTVASQVTRSADVATMTGTNFAPWYNQSEGTFVASFDMAGGSAALANNRAVLVARESATSGHNIYNGSGQVTGWTVVSGVDQAYLTTGALAADTATNIAYAYKANDFAASRNGGTVATDTSGTLPVPTVLGIGGNSAGSLFLSGHIRQIAYYNTRLTNAQLQTLTAPPLVTTLSMSFTNQAYTVGV